MATSPTPPAATPAPSASELTKIWNWIKSKAVIVEADLAKVIGPKVTGELEAIGKYFLDGELGPLATAAITDATDVATGTMSVSKAISGLVTSAAANGKTLSTAAALQVIALVQNVVPVKTADGSITPS
jgi:hypothetical protein